MARTPKPWFWKARKGWYVTIDGQRIFLSENKTEAKTRFHELMASPQRRTVRCDSVAKICDLYLEWCQKHRATATYENYRYRLERFVRRYPKLRTHELRPFHVQEWIDSMPDLASGSHRNYVRSIKRTCRWAKKQGYIDRNPIEDMEEPRCGRRETVVSQQQFDELLAAIPCKEFRDLLIVTWETGCRPQESLRVQARHVQVKQKRWVFPDSEGKGHIGRAVYMTDRAMEITLRYMRRFPKGNLFRNSRDIPWETQSVNCAFIRTQQKMGREIVKAQGLEPSDEEIWEFTKNLSPTCTKKGRAHHQDRAAALRRGSHQVATATGRTVRSQVFALRSCDTLGPPTRSNEAWML